MSTPLTDEQIAERVRQHTVALNPAAFTDDAVAPYGSLTGLARLAGLAPSTLARCVRGELTPGASVIAALITATGKPFDQLFTIRRD